MRVIGTGLVWALTAAIIYPLCTLAFLLWPGGAFVLLDMVFHGIDFTAMGTARGAGTLWGVFLAFCGIVVVAFVVGVVYAWMNNFVRSFFFSTPARPS